MGPGQSGDELFEEERGVDRAAVGATHVLDVGDVGVELRPVAALHRQLPNRLVRLAGRCFDLLHQTLVVAHEARDARTERTQAPVSSAMSTMASGSSSAASTRASAMTSRSSASVFMTSSVVPPRMVRTSPSFVA